MAVHTYKIGQVVHFSPGRTGMTPASREFKVVQLLPPLDGQNQYRIKGIAETFERMAKESDLSRK